MVEDNQVDLKETGEIELPEFDASKYIGKVAKIESVTEHEGNFGYYIKVATENIDTEAAFPVIASRIFGLQTTKEKDKDVIGWGKNTKLGIFLKKMGVGHYKELVGKETKVQTHTSKEGKDFLTFN